MLSRETDRLGAGEAGLVSFQEIRHLLAHGIEERAVGFYAGLRYRGELRVGGMVRFLLGGGEKKKKKKKKKKKTQWHFVSGWSAPSVSKGAQCAGFSRPIDLDKGNSKSISWCERRASLGRG